MTLRIDPTGSAGAKRRLGGAPRLLTQALQELRHVLLNHRTLPLVALLRRKIVHVDQLNLPLAEARFLEQVGIRAADDQVALLRVQQTEAVAVLI